MSKKISTKKGAIAVGNMPAVFLTLMMVGVIIILGIYVVGVLGSNLQTLAPSTPGLNATYGNATSIFSQSAALIPVVAIILTLVVIVSAIFYFGGNSRGGGM